MDNLFSNLQSTSNNEEKKYIVFDTETTGLSPERGDAIIEIAALKISEDGKEIDEFEFFINPKIPISIGAQLIHGMDDEFIAKNGKTLEEVIPKFVDFCENCTIVGHNIVKFDIPFVNKHLADLSRPHLTNELLDTLHLSRNKLQLKNYKLGTVAEHMGIPYVNAHRAMNDVRINKDVFLNLLKL